MKGREPAFLRWLALAALVDWLVTRTLARAAIFMPKAPPVLVVYRVLILGGQVASVLAALLALLGMTWLAWHYWKMRKGLLSLALLSLVVFSLVSLVIPPGGLVQVIIHLLNLAAILWIGSEALRQASGTAARIAILLVVLALLFGGLYQASQILYAVFGLPGAPKIALALFNLGELIVVLSPMGVWWAGNRQRLKQVIALPLLAAIPALGYSVLTLTNPSMAGILAIWSAGLTLYLPWPLYALSLWLFGLAFLALRRQNHPAAWALLLLAAGGYAPQLSSQAFYGLIGLSLFTWYHPQSDTTIVQARVSSFPPAVAEVS